MIGNDGNPSLVTQVTTNDAPNEALLAQVAIDVLADVTVPPFSDGPVPEMAPTLSDRQRMLSCLPHRLGK